MPNAHATGFVGRTDELRFYAEAIAKLAEKRHTYSIFNLHAITGMGKTRLAHQLYEQIQTDYGYACAWISFEPSAPAATAAQLSAHEGLRRSWKLSPLAERIDEFEPSSIFDAIEIAWEGAPARDRAIDDRAEAPFVLILDALNVLDNQPSDSNEADAWTYLQEQVIKPLVDQGNVFILCISQTPLYWSFWELRELCYPSRLRPLKPRETQSLLEQYELQESADIIYDLTKGHPASITYIIQQCVAPELALLDRQITPPHPNLPYHEVKRQIGRLQPYARRLIELAGVLRRIDVQAIRHLLQALPAEWPTLIKNQQIHAALSEYLEHGLIVCNPGYVPFSFIPEVGSVIEADMQRGEQIELFASICSLMSAWYLRELQKKPLTNRHYLNEWIYFSLQQLRLFLADAPAAQHAEHIEAWFARFTECWKKSGDTITLKRFQEDTSTQRLLRVLDMRHRVDSIILSYQVLRKKLPSYRKELVDYLFERRFPYKLTLDQRDILLLIAKQFEHGFDAVALQKKIEASRGIDRVTARQQSRAYISLFNEIQAIIYRQEERQFIMDEWLKDFLKSFEE